MEWVKLYGRPAYYHDGALLRAGEAAELLFCRALAHCAAVESRGVIDKAVLPLLVQTRAKQRAAALVREGLWIEEADRYLIRNWHVYQEEHDVAVDRKTRDRERKRDARRAARETASADCPRTVRGQSSGVRALDRDRDRDKDRALPLLREDVDVDVRAEDDTEPVGDVISRITRRLKDGAA